MDSCDFSTEMYEAMSDPSDRELKTFSFSRTEKYILPMLADAENAAGKKLKLMLSPWSPPAFMKTNGERKHGGSLKPEYREALYLIYFEDLSYRSAATVVSKSEQQIKNLVYRGKQSLKTILEQGGFVYADE